MSSRSCRTVGRATLAAWLFAVGVAAMSGGVRGAQQASPEATPTMPDCTADLGIVRSAKICLNVVHASPDAPAVDVYLNGSLAIENLAFGNASGFLEVPGGAYRVHVVPTGGNLGSAIIDVPGLSLTPGAAYEIVAVGLLADITAQVYEVDVTALPEANPPLRNARIRVVHAAPDAPAVDVSFIAGDVAQRAVTNLAFPKASDYVVRPGGSYRVIVNVAGANDVALSVPDVSLEGGKVYSIYAIGTVADGTLALLLVGTSASSLPAATPEATPAG